MGIIIGEDCTKFGRYLSLGLCLQRDLRVKPGIPSDGFSKKPSLVNQVPHWPVNCRRVPFSRTSPLETKSVNDPYKLHITHVFENVQ